MKKLLLLFFSVALFFVQKSYGQAPDPAVTNIQTIQSAGCFDSASNVLVNITNWGSTLDLSVNNLVVNLKVTSPSGFIVYRDTIKAGIVATNTTLFQNFQQVNLYKGGCYSMNTTLVLLGGGNVNMANDSLLTAYQVCNTRPTAVDYFLCKDDTIATGQGLKIHCPNALLDSVMIPFTLSFTGNNPGNPTACAPTGSALFASATLPTLPSSATILSGELGVSNLQLASPAFTTSPNLTRFSLFAGNTPPPSAMVYHGGLMGNPLLTVPGCFNYLSMPPATDLNKMYTAGVPAISPNLNLGNWSTNRCSAPNILANCGGNTVAYLKIIYEYTPGGIKWYEHASGGTAISQASIFDPLKTPNNIVNNSNTKGTYTFYGACGIDTNCRAVSQLVIGVPEFTSIATTPVSCSGGNDGSIVASATSSVQPIFITLLPTIAPSPFTPATFSGLSGGAYTLRATDGAGCANDSVVLITEPPAFSISANVSNDLCKGDSSGSVVMTRSGGTGLVSFSTPIPGTQTSVGMIHGLPAGTYTVVGTDWNGCTTTTAFTITEPATKPTITNVTSTTPSCMPGCDATMTVTAQGGTAPYTSYHYGGPPQVSNVFVNVCAGVYSVSVTDANGCTAQSTTSIIPPAAPTFISVTKTNVSCNGGSDGTISVTALPGSNPTLSYQIVGLIQIGPNSTGNFIGLPAGAYTVQAVDGNGCNIQTIATITEPPPLSFSSIVKDNPNCLIGNDGNISVSGQGGTMPYSFGILPSVGVQFTPGFFSNLSAGNYYITSTDANGCSVSSAPVLLQDTSTITIDSVQLNPANCLNVGSIFVTTSGGLGSKYFTILPDPNNASPSTTGIFLNLPSATYTIRAYDSAQCTTVAEIFLPQVTPAFTSVNIDHANCINSNGSITAVASSINSTITYSILPNVGSQTSPGVFINLPSGNYTVTATDASGCTVTTNVVVNYAQPPSIASLSKVDVFCWGGTNGSISYTGQGGSGNYTYNLVTYNLTNSTGVFTGLLAGTYVVAVIDTNGCSADTSVTITEPPKILITATTQDPSCGGLTDGQIQLSASGGTGTIGYDIGGPTHFLGLFVNLAAGVYTATATDANNCTATTSITLTSKDITLLLAEKINESCLPGEDGKLSVYGAPTDTNYLYSIDSINWVPSGVFSNLSKGIYKTYLKNSVTGCRASRLDTIGFENNIPLNEVVVHGEKCFKQNDGEIIAPNNQLTYSLIPNAGTVTTSGIQNIPPGIYTLIAEQANGCRGEKVIVVDAADSFWISYVTTAASNVHCYGSAQIQANGGTPFYTYELTPNNGRVTSPGFYEALCWGDYVISVTDGRGCKIEKNITVEEDLNAPENMFDHFVIYPNPADDKLWIKSDYLIEYKLSLVNSIGQCQLYTEFHDKVAIIDVSKLSSGLYILRFESAVDKMDIKVLIGH